MKILGDIDLSEGGEITNATIAFGDNFPASANKGELFYKNNAGLFVFDGTTWVTFVNKAGDTMEGSLSLPKASGEGLKVNGTYGWKDLTGDISPKSSGPDAPILATIIGNIRGFAYQAADQGEASFHLPHDYAPGTDLFIHAHWCHNGTNISGSISIALEVTYAKGHSGGSFHTPVTTAITVSSLNITNTPQYSHRVDEIQVSNNGGSSSMLNTAIIEPDGLILVNYKTNTIPTISGSASRNEPFLLSFDLHYQSTGMATKNKSPNFYA